MPNNLLNIRNAITAFADHLEDGATLRNVVPAVAHPMNQGVDGTSGKVLAKSGATLFMKILNADQLRWIKWDSAVALTKQAGEAGLSPKLVAADQKTASFLFADLDECWRPSIVLDLRDTGVRNSIISATKNLHKLTPTIETQSVMQRIAAMRDEMETGTRSIISGTLTNVTPPENYTAMCAAVDKIGHAFMASGQDTAPCHIENSLSNFMLGPSGAVQIVDFDRAVDSDPLSDIGALCNEYYRTDDDVAQTVECYLGHAAADTIARVKLHMILSAFYWGMWGKVSQFSTDRTEIEYYKYGENQFVRCGYYISIWDIEQLIGEM